MTGKRCKLVLLAPLLGSWAHGADKPIAAQLEFFETRVRPVLAKNCYGCHSSGTQAPMGGLLLDSRNGMRTGGKSGPAIVPGKPQDSLLIQAIRYEGRKMPPSGQLADAAIADLTRWVAMGAPDPRGPNSGDSSTSIDSEKGGQYWAFQPPMKAALPKVKNRKWSAEPIDRFLLAAIERARIAPVADADRTAWLRRVTLDLTGLPSTPEEIAAFLYDTSRNAFAKVADRLLASPRFGERWARHWLDVARYAENSGRSRDYAFPFAWRYRNWVIGAFNADLPYDQFVREQIAGDLLPADDALQRNRQLIATAFLALGSHDLVEQNPAVFRMEVVAEQINVTSRAFMGITVGCARCHDHKFDPIAAADYYAMAGIFKSTEMLSGLQRRPRDNASYFSLNLLAKLSHAGGEPAPALDPEQQRLLDELADMQQNPRRAILQLAVGLGSAQKPRSAVDILRQLDRYPLPADLAMGVRDADRPADTELLINGDIKNAGQRVPRGFPKAMLPLGSAVTIPADHSGRLELAEWLSRRDNPTTARVAVNRIWQHLFGEGLVRSVDNLGAMGEKPVNQPLLDYLALRFMDQGWSTKKLIREIVLSRAYRLSATVTPRNEKADPDNRLLWRANRRRLEVEAIRDSILMAAGQLDLNPSAASPVLAFSRATPLARRRNVPGDDYAASLRIRSIYVPVLRNALPEMFEAFDFPEPSEAKGLRDATTVPTQALFLMNSRFVIELSRAAALRLLGTAGGRNADALVMQAYLETLSRAPSSAETARALTFLKQAAEEAQSAPSPPADPPGRRQTRQKSADTLLPPVSPEIAAWSHFYQALFASAEFRYRG